jgi:hypothetical protein
MNQITKESIIKASTEAVKLWALSSTQYPSDNRPIQLEAEATMIEVISSFALNARRTMEVLPKNCKYPLNARRWHWEPTTAKNIIGDLWESLNFIIHAQDLQIGFERLPESTSIIQNGAICIPYILAKTDRKELSYVDPFAMSHAYLYQVMPQFTINLTSKHINQN